MSKLIATIATRPTRSKVMLTHRGVEALRPETAAYRIPDLRSPGLAIRVAPSGLKTWDLAFRIRGAGMVRRTSLGPFPAIGLEAARDRAAELSNAAKAGRDRLAEEQAANAAQAARPSVEVLIENYLQRQVRGRLRTAWEIELRLKRTLAPVKDRPADEIRRRDLREILDATADRGTLREAQKQRELVRGLFGWALSQDIVTVDPTAGLLSYGSSPRRDRVLSPEEINRLWHWLSTSGMPQDYADALRLQLAVGCRIGEAGGLHAAEIDTQQWLWTLPAERSKNGRARITPLIGIARQLVQCRLDWGRTHLFLTDHGSPLTSNCVASLLVKRRKTMPIGHFTSHDLRRTVATVLVELGFPLDLVAAVLGHESGARNVRTLVRHYVRSDLIEQKKAALQAWDTRLIALLEHCETLSSAVMKLPLIDARRSSNESPPA